MLRKQELTRYIYKTRNIVTKSAPFFPSPLSNTWAMPQAESAWFCFSGVPVGLETLPSVNLYTLSKGHILFYLLFSLILFKMMFT